MDTIAKGVQDLLLMLSFEITAKTKFKIDITCGLNRTHIARPYLPPTSNIKANPLKKKPNDNAEILKEYEFKVDRLVVSDVIEINGEHCIKVNYSKSGKDPFDK